MAVEAHHLHLFYPEVLVNRGLGKAPKILPAILGDQKEGLCMPISGTSQLMSPFNNLAVATAAANGRKRKREDISFSGEGISVLLQNQIVDLDHLVAQHTQRMGAELAERRKRYALQLVGAVEFGMRKRVKAKDDEIERAKKLNWNLEERIRTLIVENQIWRELAQTNEATANVLRANLEQLLAAQAGVLDEKAQGCDGASAADDAESCFCGENDDGKAATVGGSPAWTCRSCGQREPTVLLLPCRHLCVCVACGPAVDFCPICNCNKSGSVNVNLS
ncbi:hypothetical protein HPP92_018995 [Vanilla planifolia]|uniref:RING-type domain-containing protein n=1 Tax=Vanilla planifolia TaxID=51239 RepID=A0A835Q3E3_VANPL|nr:hypothetical protein HPP92_019554 [Vanilla planifolia]KAG0464831.1 hypothetical protein HPP92_018995 [Vanilla planifolia]